MPRVTLTFTQNAWSRFGAYARDAVPWEGEGEDTRTTRELFRMVQRTLHRDILTFERNQRAEFGGTLPGDLEDPT